MGETAVRFEKRGREFISVASREAKRKRMERNPQGCGSSVLKVRTVTEIRPETERSIPGQDEIGRKLNGGPIPVLGSQPFG